jgi:hypothetical protein
VAALRIKGTAGFDFAWHEDAADAVTMGALVTLDEFERQIEFPLSRGFVHHAHKLASVTTDPAAVVKAWTEISPNAELADGLKQSLLNAQLASELDECRDAVAEEFCHCELGIEAQFFSRRIIVGANVAWIATDSRALASHADFQEWLAEIVTASNVGDQPVRGAVARMHMGVDEPRSD